jgi:hypothetical protein
MGEDLWINGCRWAVGTDLAKGGNEETNEDDESSRVGVASAFDDGRRPFFGKELILVAVTSWDLLSR